MERDKKYAKPGEAAAYLRMSPSTVKKFEKTGELVPASILDSGHRRYLWSEVIAFRKTYEKKAFLEDAQLISAPDVCKYLEISSPVLRRLNEEGRLTPCLVLPVSNIRLYNPDDVEDYLRSTESGC